VPVRDPKRICRAWNEILRMGPSEYEELSRAARQRIIHFYSLEKCLRRYETLYAGLCRSKPRSRETGDRAHSASKPETA
jgi:hypothetical protein